MTSQQAAEACDALIEECLNKGSQDNLSAILVVLGPPPAYDELHSASNIHNSLSNDIGPSAEEVNMSISMEEGEEVESLSHSLRQKLQFDDSMISHNIKESTQDSLSTSTSQGLIFYNPSLERNEFSDEGGHPSPLHTESKATRSPEPQS